MVPACYLLLQFSYRTCLKMLLIICHPVYLTNERSYRVFIHTTIQMKRIKELVIRTTDEPWEQLPICCGDTHYEILPSQDSVKIMSQHHVRCHWEPRREVRALTSIGGYYT